MEYRIWIAFFLMIFATNLRIKCYTGSKKWLCLAGYAVCLIVITGMIDSSLHAARLNYAESIQEGLKTPPTTWILSLANIYTTYNPIALLFFLILCIELFSLVSAVTQKYNRKKNNVVNPPLGGGVKPQCFFTLYL